MVIHSEAKTIRTANRSTDRQTDRRKTSGKDNNTQLSCSVFFSYCLCLTDLVTVFYRPVFGHTQSDLCWFHSSTGWAILLESAISSWSAGAGILAHYKDIEAREALEILQKFPITFVFFLPRIYIGASKEDLKSFHFPKLSSCMTGGEPMNKEVVLQWKEGTANDLREVYGQTEGVSYEYACG